MYSLEAAMAGFWYGTLLLCINGWFVNRFICDLCSYLRYWDSVASLWRCRLVRTPFDLSGDHMYALWLLSWSINSLDARPTLTFHGCLKWPLGCRAIHRIRVFLILLINIFVSCTDANHLVRIMISSSGWDAEGYSNGRVNSFNYFCAVCRDTITELWCRHIVLFALLVTNESKYILMES
jgi:hypothetical protein